MYRPLTAGLVLFFIGAGFSAYILVSSRGLTAGLWHV